MHLNFSTKNSINFCILWMAFDHPASGLGVFPDSRKLSLTPDPRGADRKAGAMSEDAVFVLNTLFGRYKHRRPPRPLHRFT
jgi:hypothetical protein